MQLTADIIQDRFCVAGISYKKASTVQRGRFAVNASIRKAILQEAKDLGLKSVLVLSTCNRTEIYGYASNPDELAQLLCRHTQGEWYEFSSIGFQAYGSAALHHLFRMASGLDSQIIGDYEIQGQLKHAVAASRNEGMIGPVMDRTLNFVFQASKKIRSTTKLSAGTVSVSFAAIEWLRKHIQEGMQKVLVIGTGKFGTNVCKNLATYLPQCNLVICNRTDDKAQELANQIGAGFLPFASMPGKLDEYDIIVTSTTAQESLVHPGYFHTHKPRLIVDLSIPANVAASVASVSGIIMANVDEISKIMEITLHRRQQAIPEAESIISHFLQEYYGWLKTYKHSPAIKRLKDDLMTLSNYHERVCEFSASLSGTSTDIHAVVQKTMDTLVVTLKNDGESGCHFIKAYHGFLNYHETDNAKPI